MAMMRQNVVLVACLCLLFLQTATSFTSTYHKSTYVKLSAAKSTIPTETVGGYTFAERVVNNVTLTTGGNSTGKPKRTVVSKNPRDWTPYVFRDADGEYDAPFINEAMWYRLSVRRNSEKKLAETLKQLRDTDENWGNMFEEVYYPQQPVVRIKDKSLVIAFKPMAPGLVYIKTKMDPDLADDIESIKGVYAFLKNPNNLIVPLSKDEGESIELMRDRNTAVIDPELMLMKKDEYVSVVSGPRKGRYGILMGAKNGKLEVCLRSEYKDDWDTFEFDQLRYLADPPEKKWMLLTPKEALESLMAKDPYNPTVKAFKKNGLLEEILYPDGRPEGFSNNNRNSGGDDWGEKRQPRSKFGSEEESRGREGGRSIRSISSNKDADSRDKSGGSSDMDDWGAMSSSSSGISTKSPDSSSGFDNSFNIAAWGDSLSAAAGGSKKKFTEEKSSDKVGVEVDEGFESFLQEAIEELKPAGVGAGAGELDDRSSGGRLIVSGGKREYIPNQEYQQKVQPKQAAKRDTTSYTASKSKSNDWFDESSSYDSFGSDSSAGTSRSTRSSGGADVNPQIEADRLDSERILNELLMDLDTGDSMRGSGSSSDREVDYFDFSMDSEDLKSGAKPPSSRQQSAGNSRTPSKPSARNSAPQMEDFVSFELYLDALVSHERSAIGGGSSYMDGASGKKSPSFNSRSSGDSDSRGSSPSNRDFDALDDNLVAFLGGEDEDDFGSKGSSRGSPQNSRSSRDSSSSDRRSDDSKPVRSWSPKSPATVVEDLAPVDDLSQFLDSLEETNVLPNKSKTPVKEVEKEKVKEVKAAPAAAQTFAKEMGSSENYSGLTLKDLKDKLRERGLPVSGNKAELVTRLSA